MIETKKSSMVTFQTASGPANGYLSLPEANAPGVLVLHAWWGLNNFFKGFCDRLANEGYVALAPDLFNGRVATTIDEAKKNVEMVETPGGKSVYGRVRGAVEYLKSHPSVEGGKVGLVGFSFGAAYALWLSTARPADVAAVVVFYGTYSGLDFSKTEASFLGHFSPNDEWEPLSGIQQLEEKLKSSGKNVNFHLYPGTKHWFFEENRPNEYQPELAELAWKRTLDFLHTHLSQA